MPLLGVNPDGFTVGDGDLMIVLALFISKRALPEPAFAKWISFPVVKVLPNINVSLTDRSSNT
jgi:hypothetical protein